MDIKKPQKKPQQEAENFSEAIASENFLLEKNISPKKPRKMISKIILLLFLVAILYASFLIFKINRLGKKINPTGQSSISLTQTIKNLAADDFLVLSGEEEGRINILLLGIAGEKKPGQNLTDTIIVASVNTETNRVGLISLPRDLFVSSSQERVQSKINSIYQIGLNLNDKDPQKSVELIQKVVEEITSLSINYYVVLNFDGFQKIVDSIGGINIMNERDIYDTRYPGANYSYEIFELEKGFHHLDGATALKYARERHSDPEGDFGRAKRQQQVLQAIKSKVFSAKTFLNLFALNELFNALGDNIVTNIQANEFGSFINLAQKADTQNINNVVVDAWDKESLLKVAHIFYGPVRAFVLVPKAGNWSEIQEVAQNIFSLNEIEKRKEAIQNENAKIKLINASGQTGLTQKIKHSLLDHLNYKSITLEYQATKEKASKTYAYDLAGKDKLFTLDEIIKTLPATLNEENENISNYTDQNQEGFDIVIVVGKDLIDIYNVEEGTLEDLENQSEEIFRQSSN